MDGEATPTDASPACRSDKDGVGSTSEGGGGEAAEELVSAFEPYTRRIAELLPELPMLPFVRRVD